MTIPMSSACDRWVFHALAFGRDGHILLGWAFNPGVRRQLTREQRAAYRYVYVALDRRLTYAELGLSLSVGNGLIVVPDDKPYTYVACRELLDVETMCRCELYPLGATRADVLLEVVTDEDLPLCMINPEFDSIHLAMVHTDTRQPDMQRITWFQEKIGPVGHELHPTIRDAVIELFRRGYNTLVPSTLLDDLAADFTSSG